MSKSGLPIVLRVDACPIGNLTDAEIEALELAVNSVRKNATTRTHSVNDIVDEARSAEGELDDRGVPKTHRVGIRYTCRHRGPGASSYKYPAIGSEFVLVRRRDCWRLEKYVRVDVWPGDRERWSFTADADIRRYLIEHAVSNFKFIDEKPADQTGVDYAAVNRHVRDVPIEYVNAANTQEAEFAAA